MSLAVLILVACILLACIVMLAFVVRHSLPRSIRPSRGYRRAIAEWIYLPHVGIEDFKERRISFELDFHGCRYSGHTDNAIDLAILYYGGYEKELLSFLGDLVDRLPNERRVFFDIGANTGQHTMFMASRCSVVHSFEPYPPVGERLLKHVEINGLSNVTVHRVGLGNKKEEVPFFEPPDDNLMAGSFKSDYKVRNRDTGLQLPIEVGDDYVSETGLEAPGIVKIDVEGLEQAVLQGLRRTLDRCRPIVLMEVTADPKLDYLYRSVDGLLRDLPEGYECYEVESGNPVVGDYRLKKFESGFSHYAQYSVVCFPSTARGMIPMGDRGA